MNKRIVPSIFTSALLVILLASAAPAQVQRTFVSGLGSDSNPCSRTAPCRTFGQAISQTNPGGEVYVLDSAGYGPFTINKSVSIVAPLGVTAGISVFSGNGIDINAGASDIVILRGLTVNNQGSSGHGILYSSGAALHVESCVVNGFVSGAGLFFSGQGQLEVKDSIMRGNNSGIAVAPVSGAASASIDNVRLEGAGAGASSIGLLVDDRSTVTIRDSLASGNQNTAFQVFSSTSSDSELNVENCIVSNNGGQGISTVSISTGVATVRVSNSTVTHNNVGLYNPGSPAVFLSRGNNTVEGNAHNTLGTIGSYTAK